MKPDKLKGLLLLGLIVFGVVIFVSSGRLNKQTNPPTPAPSPPPTKETNQAPKIVSTKPDPLEEAIISSTEVLEITFSHPLENEGEFKRRIEPAIEHEIKLSQDRKTAKIIPKKPYELGATYTLFILPDSKFDGIGEWKQEQIFHFKTVRYRGV